MKKLKLIFLLVLLISCSSVQNNNNKKHDSMPDGEYLEYFDNGQVSLRGSFLNNKKVGFFYTYYEDGTLESESLYIEGYAYGINKLYYPDGAIELYACFYSFRLDSNDLWFYRSTYDSEGKLLSEHGRYLPPPLFYVEDIDLDTDSTLTVDIFLAQPPHMNNEVRAIIFNDKNEILFNENIVLYDGYCNYTLRQDFSEKGIYELDLISDFINKPMYEDTLISDTIKFDIIVK